MKNPAMRRIDLIVIHCTATKEGVDFDVDDIRRMHLKRGWRDIGYHYLIKLDGTVEIGRPVMQTGAHARGYNEHSIGISYVGGVTHKMVPKDTRTDEQKKAMGQLVAQLQAEYPNTQVLGHRDLPKVAKACPCFNVKVEYGNAMPLPKPVDKILEIAKRNGWL